MTASTPQDGGQRWRKIDVLQIARFLCEMRRAHSNRRPARRHDAGSWEEIIVFRDYAAHLAPPPSDNPGVVPTFRSATSRHVPGRPPQHGESGLLPRTSSTMRETASIAPRPAFALRATARRAAYAMRAPSPSSRRPPASDAVSGHGVRRIARDGSLQQPCIAVR